MGVTRVRGFLLILSESGAHLGLGSGFAPSCPNRCSFGLRSGFPPNSAETGVHSDWGSGFPSHPVRIKYSFRLQFGVSSSSCPNQVLIRTSVRGFLLIISESGVLSDWISGFPSHPVRIKCSFGLQFGVSSSSCPNQVLIQTSVRGFLLFLSESDVHSDYSLEFPSHPVRIR
jgi:hypothetical protein